MIAKLPASVATVLGTLLCVCLGTFPVNGQVVSSKPLSVTGSPSPHWRPQFHATSKKNGLGKPTALIHHKGEYHVFFQQKSPDSTHIPSSWGHAVSKDLHRWQELPPVLAADSTEAYSGSCVIDRKNTAGFGKNAMVAIYTAHQNGNQSQHLAYSLDNGRTFKKYAFNPVLDLNRADFTDPHVFWWKSLDRWVMSVAFPSEQRVQFYQSKNLRNWVPAGSVSAPNDSLGHWESPALFEVSSALHEVRLATEQGVDTLAHVTVIRQGRPFDPQSLARRWVLLVSVSSGAPSGGAGVQYFIGTFNGRQFMPQDNQTRWLDYGTDFYGAIPISKPDINGAAYPQIMGWMNNPQAAKSQSGMSFQGAMTLPRTLKLDPAGKGMYSLIQVPDCLCPMPKSDSLTVRTTDTTELSRRIKTFLAGSTSYKLYIKAKAGNHDIRVRSGSGQEQTVVRYDSVAREMVLDRSRSGVMTSSIVANPVIKAPFQPIGGWNNEAFLYYSVYVDGSSVEVFGASTTCKITSLIFPGEESNGVSFGGKGIYEVLVYRISPTQTN
ncbi:glycoside hydrolase family 32 protein [Fibrella aquatica]|uniref:glycoside hydrolase family 32 protein n=1 Tax=Fibrella aquatica TaxID=3242487 RepID=UPI0035228FA6